MADDFESLVGGQTSEYSQRRARALDRRSQYKTESPGPKVDRRHRVGASQWADEGRWVGVKSSWLKAIRYDHATKELFVKFLDQAVCLYKDVHYQTAKAMFRAASMGKWTWKNLVKRPYTLVSGQTKSKIRRKKPRSTRRRKK